MVWAQLHADVKMQRESSLNNYVATVAMCPSPSPNRDAVEAPITDWLREALPG